MSEDNMTVIHYSNTSNMSHSDPDDTRATGASVLSPAIMFLAGILGNMYALFTLYRTRTDGKTTKFYTLITSLAWTDFLGILMTSPSVILSYSNGLKWVGGDIHCRYHGFAMTCFAFATPLIISAMAVERFLALKCVFFYSSRCKNGHTRKIVLILWLIVIWFAILPLFGFGEFHQQYPGTWCFFNYHSTNNVYKAYAYIFALANLLLMCIMIVCNGYVVVAIFYSKIRRETGRTRMVSDTSDQGSVMLSKYKQTSIERQMIVLMAALTGVFLICWAPLMLHIVVTVATGRSNYLWDLTTIRLASLNQTLDPWLYILLRRSLCMKLKKCFERVCPCNEPEVDSKLYCQQVHFNKINDQEQLEDLECANHATGLRINNVHVISTRQAPAFPDVTSLPVANNQNEAQQTPFLPDVTKITDSSSTNNKCSFYYGDIHEEKTNENCARSRRISVKHVCSEDKDLEQNHSYSTNNHPNV